MFARLKHRKQHEIKGIECLNCKAPLKGDENFCPYCGQKNDIRPLSIRLYFNNFLSNFFNFDGRIWRTIIYLIKDPGKVPLDYISGKRVVYSNPFKFLLQVSILYFLLSGILNFFLPDNEPTKKFVKLKSPNNRLVFDIQEPLFDSINQMWHFTEKLKDNKLPKKIKDSIINEILKSEGVRFSFDNGKIINESLSWSNLKKYLNIHGVFYDYYPKITNSKEFEKQNFWDKIGIIFNKISNDSYSNLNEQDVIRKLGIQSNFSNRLALKIAQRSYLFFNDKKTRESVKKSIVSKISMALFFILPVLALFFQIFYPKTHSYTETLVYIFYVQSVYFLVLLIELFGQYFLPFGLDFFLSFVVEIWFLYYLFRSTLIFYRQKKWKNTLKVAFLIIPSYAILSGVGLLIITIISMIL